MEFVDTDDQLREIAQIARKCPTATLRRAFISSLRDFCSATHWLRTPVTMTTAGTSSGLDGTYQITLPDPQQEQYLDVIAIRDHIIGLDETNPSQPIEFKIRPGDPSQWRVTDNSAQPRWYAYRPEGMFDLNPLPDIVYTLRLPAVILTPKEEARRVPRDILTKYSTPIQAGALAYLLQIPGQPWSNPAGAKDQTQDYKTGITDAKIEAQRYFATGSQRVRPRRFLRL